MGGGGLEKGLSPRQGGKSAEFRPFPPTVQAVVIAKVRVAPGPKSLASLRQVLHPYSAPLVDERRETTQAARWKKSNEAKRRTCLSDPKSERKKE